MKSFFKKLSLVLAAAMVITMLPVQAKAATSVAIGDVDDYTAANNYKYATGYTMEIGDEVIWSFDALGAKYTGANTAAARPTAKWDVAGDAVTVTAVAGSVKATVKAVKAGTATVKFSITVAGVDYEGSNTVTVKAEEVAPTAAPTTAPAKAFEVTQPAYDTIVLKFATAEEAAAAVKKVYLRHMKTTVRGDLALSAKYTAPAVDADDATKVVITGLQAWDYGIYLTADADKKEAPDARWTVAYGDAAVVDLEYDTFYIGEAKLDGNTTTYDQHDPKITVYDANGIKLKVDGSIRYTSKKSSSTTVTFSTVTGRVTLRNINATCEVTATYTVSGKTPLVSDPYTCTATQYVAPSLGGFIEEIALVKDGKKSDKIEWAKDQYDYEYAAEMNVGEVGQVYFYFLATDNKRYTAAVGSFKDAAFAGTRDTDFTINKLGSKYTFELVKDDATSKVVSVTKDGLVRAYKQGKETLLLNMTYDGKADSTQTVGYITITVAEEAKPDTIVIETTDIAGFADAADPTAEVKFTVYDQYGNKYKIENDYVTVAKTDKSAISGVTAAIDGKDKATGKISLNYNTIGETKDTANEYTLTVKYNGYEKSENFAVTVAKLQTSDAQITYSIKASNVVINNKLLATAENKEASIASLASTIALNIQVSKTINEVAIGTEAFSVCSEDILSLDNYTPLSGTGNLYVVVYKKNANGDVSTVAQMANGVEISTNASDFAKLIRTSDSSKLNKKIATFGGADVTTTSELNFVIAQTATNAELDKTAYLGEYVIYLFGKNDAGKLTAIDEKSITISEDVHGIGGFDTTYVYKNDGKGKNVAVLNKTNDGKIAKTAVTSTSWTEHVAQVINDFSCSYDFNHDGTITIDETGKLSAILARFEAGSVPTDSIFYIKGADNKSAYIKCFDIVFTLPGGARYTQTVDVYDIFEFKFGGDKTACTD